MLLQKSSQWTLKQNLNGLETILCDYGFNVLINHQKKFSFNALSIHFIDKNGLEEEENRPNSLSSFIFF